jgi:hypothetical protein
MTSEVETSPKYPSGIGRVIPSVGVWRKPRLDTTASRVGVVGNPEYYTDFYAQQREADIEFWWKGRIPEVMDNTLRLYSAKELARQEAKERRKQKKGTVL